MAELITITCDVKPSIVFLEKMKMRVKRGGTETIRDFTKDLARELEEYIARHHHDTGVTENNITSKLESPTRAIVKMPLQGIWLDRMRPHWVPFYSKPYKYLVTNDIKGWAKRHGLPINKMRGIYVRPHPYIDMIFYKTLYRHQKLLDKRVKSWVAV